MTHLFSWESLWIGGIIVLGLGLAWGLLQYKLRHRANDKVTEEATRLMRDHSTEEYMNVDRPRLERKLE